METIDEIMRKLVDDEESDDGFLYHYTDANALYGIVRSKKLWLSDILSMNDLSEFLHIHEVARNYVEFQLNNGDSEYTDTLATYQEHLKNAEENPSLAHEAESYKRAWIDPEELRQELSQFYQLLSDKIGSILSEPRSVTPKIYVTSLSEKGDQLSQWRGYCPRGGYSLGFKHKALRNAAMRDNVVLVKCLYDWGEKQGLVEKILTTFHQSILELDLRHGPDNPYGLIADIIKALERFSPVVKHQGFEEEVEWRLVNREALFPDGQSQERQRLHRPRNAVLVPYFELDLGGNFSFSESFGVTVGPMPNQSEGVAFSRQFLQDEGIASDTAIYPYQDILKVSSIPYRIM